MGGVPPLGYDVIDRKLIINPKEAKLVKHIFKRFTEIESTTLLVKELKKAGYTNKPRTNRYGKRVTTVFIKGGLYRVLNNRVYLGEIKHKDKHYAGEHKVIISQAVWDRVQEIFSKNSHTRGNQTRANTPAILRGLLFDELGNAIVPTHTRKGGRLYRYYISTRAIQSGYDESPVRNIPAGEIVRRQLG